MLINHGLTTHYNNDLVEAAIQSGNISIVRLLQESCTDGSFKFRWLSLMSASCIGNDDIVQLIIEDEMVLDQKILDESLMCSIKHEHMSTTNLLIKNGAAVNIDLFYEASGLGYVSCMEMLYEKLQPDKTELDTALSHVDQPSMKGAIELLLGYGADITARCAPFIQYPWIRNCEYTIKLLEEYPTFHNYKFYYDRTNQVSYIIYRSGGESNIDNCIELYGCNVWCYDLSKLSHSFVVDKISVAKYKKSARSTILI
jgi:hypothetical protein